jgi:hypothetical protein
VLLDHLPVRGTWQNDGRGCQSTWMLSGGMNLEGKRKIKGSNERKNE